MARVAASRQRGRRWGARRSRGRRRSERGGDALVDLGDKTCAERASGLVSTREREGGAREIAALPELAGRPGFTGGGWRRCELEFEQPGGVGVPRGGGFGGGGRAAYIGRGGGGVDGRKRPRCWAALPRPLMATTGRRVGGDVSIFFYSFSFSFFVII